jgi:hypothetical protein
MRKIREVLRLRFDGGLSVRKIARSLVIGHSSVGDYLSRFAASGLSWPINLSDAELNRRLFPLVATVPSEQRPMPDWAWAHAELRRPGVTLALLWQEYRLSHPQGFQYSWFCEHYRRWAGKVDVVMRQEHRAGEKLFVDYAGQTETIGKLKVVIDRIMARKAGQKTRSTRLVVIDSGQPKTTSTLRKRFDDAREAAGIPKAEFQMRDLRAKAATDKEESTGCIRKLGTSSDIQLSG